MTNVNSKNTFPPQVAKLHRLLANVDQLVHFLGSIKAWRVFLTFVSGVTWTKPFPKSNYEFRLEAMRVQGSDFFAGITFPVGGAHCSWINGGWGGMVVGLSSLDDMDASENDTGVSRIFESGRWYRLRLRVTELSPLRNGAGAERFCFKVTSIARTKFDERSSGRLFTVPGGFSEIDPPPF